MKPLHVLWIATALSLAACSDPGDVVPQGNDTLFGEGSPWVSFYGRTAKMGDLDKVAQTFRIINIEADPAAANFTPAQIQQLKAGGKNRVISYLNLGSCERSRTYWSSAPSGLTSCGANTAAQLAPYDGYPNETWMDVGNPEYQRLILEHVAPRLAAQGIDGFFLDNMEILENPDLCDDACIQGGLDLVRKIREKYPTFVLIMQNATDDVLRTGTSNGRRFADLLDGLSHEDVYIPASHAVIEEELLKWKNMNLNPGHRFWIGIEDYVGDCNNVSAASHTYSRARAVGFSPYVSDSSDSQQVVCYWPF